MWTWLSHLDPNVAITALSILSLGGKWLYHKIRGDKQASLVEQLAPTIRGIVTKLAESPFVAETVREKLTKAAHEALGRLGIKRNALVDQVVAGLVDAGVTEVRERVANRLAAAALPAQLEAVASAASKVAEAFKVPAVRTVPVIGEGLPGEFQVEIVKPTP